MAIEILQAIMQHANYLTMVRRCVAEGMQHSRCCDHNSCVFGRWYDGTGTEMIARMSGPEPPRLWAEIGTLHKALHSQAMEAVEYRDTDMRKAVNLETAMMQRSTLLVNRLLELDALVTKLGVS